MDTFTAFISWPSAPLTASLVRKSLSSLDPSPVIVQHLPNSTKNGVLQWATYDEIDHELTYSHDHHSDVLSSAYTFRKALTRKHFLSCTIHSYLTKNPSSILGRAVPKTFELEISFADELDEILADDLWDLSSILDIDPCRWWILKPGMADRGNGIRLFNSKSSLLQIFESFEGEQSSDEDDDTAVATSQLRHFVIQEYLPNPLLIDPAQVSIDGLFIPKELQGHKFHLRVYCVASGALQLYVCKRILALFSAVPYAPPERGENGSVDLTPHLTNTSLQTHRGEESVRLLDELIGCHIQSGVDETNIQLSESHVADLTRQISSVLAETFKAGLQNPVHFQALPNAFELFGVDFLVTHQPLSEFAFQIQLLEINSEPAIELTGPRLSWILEDLFVSIGRVCVQPFFTKCRPETWPVGESRFGLLKCLDEKVRAN
ncbi:tubulin-tyrosine ligase [Guyanagaster necrorhizus]|uniref:Tubulin-tyrosine ligase n=1 Tax=Guyanagaster necrorhizus TaxID=856835 RepID=A0A9P7W180_9AGAR|nr:tubulin-tyrosine ligase [Guyanagaster necrorhizus MCA 3950]KAG7450353.1 tubulin-tyrosine ligase [Guyanagaster necrorhizus MCA 3950]